jgi:hypothetical protein
MVAHQCLSFLFILYYIYNLKTIYFRENWVFLTFCFPHDVTHQIAGRGFSHQKVFGPSGQVLQVEPDSVSLGQRIEVDRVEPEQVVAGELSVVPLVLFTIYIQRHVVDFFNNSSGKTNQKPIIIITSLVGAFQSFGFELQPKLLKVIIF